MTAEIVRAGAILTIDLGAVVSNWRQLCARANAAECAAVVKADAYGLGAAQVGAALEEAGCRTFFVAHLEEGLSLRRALTRDARIMVLNGTPPGTERDFTESALIPVVNTPGELARWRAYAQATGTPAPVVLQIDSGMTRLGLSASDIHSIAADKAAFDGLSVELVMSHLACADDPAHAASEMQRSAFERLRSLLPTAPASLANSSGIFLGPTFHHDLARPGAALYGINPTPGLPNPMQAVVGLRARVLQRRDVETEIGVGYGHAIRTQRVSTLLTISLGYADGWPRNASAAAFLDGNRLPFIGRVSMDSIIIDATDCPAPVREGDFLDLICAEQTVDDIAGKAGTIGYEILTRLGCRFERRYLSPPAAAPKKET